MKKITKLQQINYHTSHEGRLLFVALATLMATVYKKKTLEQVIRILNNQVDEHLPAVKKPVAKTRSAKTGLYVKKEFAKKHPNTTVKESK